MQQQEHAKFDLLAVFNDENKADAAEAGLHKAGFGEDEVFRVAKGSVGGGQFREHGPNLNRSAVFLQTTRSGPNPRAIILFAVMSFIRNQYFLAKTDDGHRLLFRAKKCLISARYVLQVEGVASYKTRSSSCMLC